MEVGIEKRKKQDLAQDINLLLYLMNSKIIMGVSNIVLDSLRSRKGCLKDGQLSFFKDLNMVCAGEVRHPEQWQWTGWQEIMRHRERYCLIPQNKQAAKTGRKNLPQFGEHDLTQLKDTFHCGLIVVRAY
jgi:hypothetical protein